MLYAKATDPRVSAGDHVEASVPLHMDIHQLQASVKPERWLDCTNKLDMGVSASAENLQDGVTRSVLSIQPCTIPCIPPFCQCRRRPALHCHKMKDRVRFPWLQLHSHACAAPAAAKALGRAVWVNKMQSLLLL